jgi:translocation and assembly module TamB
MTSPNAEPRRRWVWKSVLIAAILGVILLSLAGWYASTSDFQAMVRRHFVAQLERVTGGRVELGSIHSVPFRFQVEVRDLTIHGSEQPGQTPYAHVDRLVAHMKLSSVLGGELGFHSISLDHPVIHIIVDSRGITNQPTPATSSASALLERLFRFSANRLELRQGVLLWNDQKIPLDFTANDVTADMYYSFLHRKYSGNIAAGKIDTRFDEYRPASWQATASFDLANDSLVIHSLAASSGKSQLRASARIIDFNQPNLVGQYELTLDLGEVAAITHDPQLRRGMLQLTGNGSWSGLVFSTQGKMQVSDLDWRDEWANVQASALAADYALNPQRLQLHDVSGKLFGGEIGGEAQILNWKTGPSPVNRPKNDAQLGMVRLRLKDLSAQAIAAALSSTGRPFYRLELAGLTSGTVDTHWKGPVRNAETELALEVAPPSRVPEGHLPLNAHVRAIYRSAPGELQLSEFSANTRASQVHASGTMSTNAALNVSLATTNFEEWEDVLGAFGYEEQLPFSLRGHAAFTGTATGRLNDIDFAGRLQSQDSELILAPTSAHPHRRTIRWDSLSTNLQLSPHIFTARGGRLRRANSSIRFDVTAGLEKRQFTRDSSFSASVQMLDADAAEILAFTGYPDQVTGKLDLALTASGTRAKPAARGSFHLSGAAIHGATIARVDSNFDFTGSVLRLSDIHFAQDLGQVAGSGSYDFLSRSFQLNLNGTNFDLAHVPMLAASPVAVRGRIDFTAQASGSPSQPTVNAEVHLRDLTFDQERAGDYTIEAVTRGSDLRLTGRSQFKDAELNLEGDVQLLHDWPAKIDLQFNRLQVDPLLAVYLDGVVTGQSLIAGDIHLHGPIRNPRALQATGTIADLAADLEHVQVRNNGDIRFVVSDQVLKIERFRLTGKGTDLELAGSLQLVGPRALQLHAEGNADLALIHDFNPAVTSSGAVAVDVTAQGTLAHPALQGHLQVSGGLLQYSDLPSALSDLNGSLVFNQDRLQIETLTAHAGGGTVTFGGYASLYNRELNFDFSMDAQEVRLRYPPGVSSMSTANLRWAGSATASTLSGKATITKLAVTPGFDFGSYVERSAQASALPQTNPLLSSIRMDVHIVTTPDLQMQTAALTLSGNADFHLRGNVAKPVLLGRADILEGQIIFNGTKYRMERGEISFTNPVTTTPVLDLQASTRLREYDVMVNLSGPLDKLNLSYHSEPPLPTADIISLLSPVGSPQQQFGSLQQQSGQSPFAQQASSAVLAEALNSALSNRSQRLFGISHIKIDPQGLNTETTPTQATPLPTVTIEQQVRDNVTLTYTTDVAQTSQQIIQGEYNFTRNLSVVGIRDFNGVVSFEFRVRQQKK